jgi:hypothetical protein
MILEHLKKKIEGERGQSILELALILPVLLMLVLGISEFGRAWMTLNIMTGAVREGARIASVTPNLPDNKQEVSRYVRNYLLSYNIEATVSVMEDASMDGMWRVLAIVDFEFMSSPFVRHVIGTDITMARSATCYYEGQY